MSLADPVKCEVLLIVVGKCSHCFTFSTGHRTLNPEDLFKRATSSILTVINYYSKVESLAELHH